MRIPSSYVAERPARSFATRFALGLWLAAGPMMAMTAPAGAQPADDPADRTQDVLITPYSPNQVRIPFVPPSEGDRLERQDEVAFVQALSLIRTGRTEDGLELLRGLLERYPASPRVISATASAWTRVGDPRQALRVLSKGARRIKEEYSAIEEEAERPAVPTFSVQRAEAYLALDDESKAIRWMVQACAERPVDSQHLRALLLDWAPSSEMGPRVAREAGKRGDEEPGNVPLAMLVAELEALAGEWDQVAERLNRAQAEAVQGRPGELLRALGHRMSARPGAPPGSDAPLWLELAGGPYALPIRYEAMRLLLVGDDLPTGDRGKPRADYLPAKEVFEAWTSLPDGSDRVELGLELTAYLRQQEEWDLAKGVGDELGKLDLPENLEARVEFERGLAYLRSGELPDAMTHLEQAKELAVEADVHSEASFALAEASFYSGEFEAAHELYDAFARDYSHHEYANDALERVYLLEAGSPLGGGIQDLPGLEELAAGLYAERRGLWDEAAEHARSADADARRGEVESQREAVQAHALLLLSRSEERRGNPEEALAAALLVADSLSQGRLAPTARQRAGNLLLAEGRLDEALAQYEELLARYPRSWLAPEVRRQVTRLRAGGAQ